MTFPRGTIVFATDPFRAGESGRPWVIVNTSAMPFHGEQYVVLTLTTKTWYEQRLPIDDDHLVAGGLPDASSILPWAVASIDSDSIDHELARLDGDVVDEAVVKLGTHLGIQ